MVERTWSRALALCLTIQLVPMMARGDTKRTVTFALDKSFGEREKDSVSQRAITGDDRLVLFASWSKPRILGAGSVPNKYGPFWQMVPATADHKEYLQRRDELLRTDPMKLVQWCEKKKLKRCAEFELRIQLQKIRNFKDKTYKKYHRKWIRYADKRQLSTSFPLPFSGEWHIAKDSTGHHRIKAGAAYAFDCVIHKNKSPYRGRVRSQKDFERLKLEDFYAFNKEILAQADGVVVSTEDQHEDHPIGQLGGFNKANYVSINYGGGIYGFYAHLKKGSVTVKKGDKVKAGQVIGRVGNSGASGMPHLHFTMMDAFGISVKGRFHYKKKSGKKWREVKGKNLIEGATVKNLRPFTQSSKNED